MRELGPWAGEEHRRILQLATTDPTAQLICVGEEFGRVFEAIEERPGSLHFATCEELRAYLEAPPIKQAMILIKASRGIGLERILDLL